MMDDDDDGYYTYLYYCNKHIYLISILKYINYCHMSMMLYFLLVFTST